MGEHTPGPWGWVYSDATCSRPIALSSDDEDVLLASEDADGPRAYVGPGDARLIAAAPDLLRGCRFVADSINRARETNPHTPGCPCPSCEVLRVVGPAIRRAIGDD